jgi:CheY-like chemotaxis protein
MTVREQLLEISELNIAKRLMQMNEGELHEYVQKLNSFVEEFPAHEVNIKKALSDKDYLSLSKNLVFIKDMLISIYADALADDCLKQINGFTDIKHEKIEAYITYFLSMLTMLSIDIQMAILKDENVLENKRPAKVANDPEIEHKTILAVDDNAFFLDMLKNILIDSEYKLTCVVSSRDALKFIQNHRPSLFILDIEMPQLNGYELAKKIKEAGHTSPIIFLTANATKEYVVDAVNAGGVDFIVKPPNKEYVLSRIAKYI